VVTSGTTAWEVAAAVPDPELPMVTLADLGILRDVEQIGTAVTVTITPTYSGCPAMHEIHSDVRKRLAYAGFPDAEVRTVLRPAWTTDWITEAGREKLARAGIAPPTPGRTGTAAGSVPLTLTAARLRVVCPRCGSVDTEELARFAATACQSLQRCRACAEPFNAIKEI
jgi:ring-1,2-phenylacetyl-CoA epoxidase subunit PaaD